MKTKITDYLDKWMDILDAQKIITTLCTQYELDASERKHLDTAFWELSEVYKSFFKKADEQVFKED